MNTYEDIEIEELPLGVPFFRKKIEDFLKTNGLHLEEVDSYIVIRKREGDILGGGGIRGNIIKCVAISEDARSKGLAAPLVSRLISLGSQRGFQKLRVFTKPENQEIFESLGFRLIAEAPKAVLMENGLPFRHHVSNAPADSGIIVINANPFTKGHRYLIEKASRQAGHLFVLVVEEDVSHFPFKERLAMVREGCADLKGVSVMGGGDSVISLSAFPSYFLKDLSDAAPTQMALDLDLFVRQVAPSFNASVRFVGSEPSDQLTAAYNELMKKTLPPRGIKVIEIPRLELEGKAVSASAARSCGSFARLRRLVPDSSLPYILADWAEASLMEELHTPLKPGLVGPDGSGSHEDMDLPLMEKSIKTIRPYFAMIAAMQKDIVTLGKEAEKAMLTASGGINTHKGAIFSMGLALYALGAMIKRGENPEIASLQKEISLIAGRIPEDNSTNGYHARKAYGAAGALEMARRGYPSLPQWLAAAGEDDNIKVLLLILSELDDTNILHRGGPQALEFVKKTSKDLLENFDKESLKSFGEELKARNLSPGGAADMLALSLFLNKIFKRI